MPEPPRKLALSLQIMIELLRFGLWLEEKLAWSMHVHAQKHFALHFCQQFQTHPLLEIALVGSTRKLR